MFPFALSASERVLRQDAELCFLPSSCWRDCQRDCERRLSERLATARWSECVRGSRSGAEWPLLLSFFFSSYRFPAEQQELLFWLAILGMNKCKRYAPCCCCFAALRLSWQSPAVLQQQQSLAPLGATDSLPLTLHTAHCTQSIAQFTVCSLWLVCSSVRPNFGHSFPPARTQQTCIQLHTVAHSCIQLLHRHSLGGAQHCD